MVLDHIAVLSRNLLETGAKLPRSLKRHPVETFPAEGTKEQYFNLAAEGGPSLLLLEAIAEGPYLRTLEKRGPGLHHFCYHTQGLELAVQHFSKHGLLLHPVSLKTMKQNVVWMCRPGIPFLVEITATADFSERDAMAVEVMLPGLDQEIDWMPGLRLLGTSDGELRLSAGDTRLVLESR